MNAQNRTMARRKTSPPPPPDSVPPFEQVVEELTVQVQQLTGETRVLREAIDDLRTEIEWLARNLLQSRCPPQALSSMSQESGTTAVEDVAEAVSSPATDDSPDTPKDTETLSQRGLFD